MQDILVVVAIALAIFFLPRLMGRKPAPDPKLNSRSPIAALAGWIRLAILITILWVAGCAAFLRPWTGGDLVPFFCIGLGPVLVLWGGVWVWSGYKKYRR